MVACHFFQAEMPPAFWADTTLALICGPLLAICEDSDVQVFFIAGQNISVDALFIGHVIVRHKVHNLFFQFRCINENALESVIKASPVGTFHLPAVGGESQFGPFHDTAEICPSLICVWVVLVYGHVFLCFPICYPVDGGL